MDPARARANRSHGARGREPEIVVAVEVDRNPGPEPLARPAHERPDRLRRGDPDRVDHDRLLRARLDRPLVDRLEEARVGACAVDAEEGDLDPVARGESDAAGDSPKHLLPRDAERLELQVRDRRLDDARGDPQLDERLEIGRHCPGEAPDLGVQPRLENHLERALVVGGDAREACLDPLDPELVEPTRDLELLLRVENDADRLLAVPERRIVEADLGVDRRVAVDLAGPDAVVHRKSSGKEESFSAPSAVTRKLSSTRRPPPSGQ